MKSFKEYLKQLKEDVIIAKEDEGGAPMGDVSAPSTDATPPTDVQTPNGSLSTNDVLGKCDHKHDGFFGPGCFHRPMPIFSYPLSRIPKKKKKNKYIKVLDLTESEEFSSFNSNSQNIINDELQTVNDYIQKIDPELTCGYSENYDFSGEKENWVGVLDKENQENTKHFNVAINLPAIYMFLEQNGLETDEIELRCQIRATLWHEIGHALIDYFKDQDIFDLELDDSNEEKTVEEFSNYMMREYTGKTSSKLNDFIDEVFGEKS